MKRNYLLYVLTIVQCLMLMGFLSTANGENNFESSASPEELALGFSIVSDIDLYNVCSRDINKPDFPNTSCGMYMQGAFHMYQVSSTTSVPFDHIEFKKDKAVDIEKQCKKYISFPLAKSMAVGFIEFMNKKKDSGDYISQHPSSFLFEQLFLCDKLRLNN